MDEEQSVELNPDRNIERLIEVASEVYVHSKFPEKTVINGRNIKYQDPGGLTTINAMTGREENISLWPPEQMKDRYYRTYYNPGEKDADTLFFAAKSVADDEKNQFTRITFIGVEQPNSAIAKYDKRAGHTPIPITFQFDIPKAEMDLFWQLFTSDRDKAPQNISKLISKMYMGLLTTADDPEKGLIMKPIEKLVGVDKTFSVNENKWEQTNPKRIFP